MQATQRRELERTLKEVANNLRGTVDGWDFKSYVLGTLFYRYISENLTHYFNQNEWNAGNPDFDYAQLDDANAEFARDETVREKGFFLLPSHLFNNVRDKAKNNEKWRDSKLNEHLKEVFASIESSAQGTDSQEDFEGLFNDIDVDGPRLGHDVVSRNRKLAELLNTIGKLELGEFQENSIDLFGDAYEYLMGMYASQAGKSGGEYFTPQEVSNLLARLTVTYKEDGEIRQKEQVNGVYDPACGSGSLMLQYAKVLGKDNVRKGFYGQEINLTTYNLARINMFLHDINYSDFDIAHGDTLVNPAHWDTEPFEAIVSNPPYSTRWEGSDNPLLIDDPRYSPAGVLAPKSKADLAFTMHMLSWLAPNGTAAIVEFPGVLYRGGAEQKIRQYLVKNNYVDTVIQLPGDMFYGTTITTCIIVLKKAKTDSDVLFIDASRMFKREGTRNVLTEAHRKEILEIFANRTNVEYAAQLVSNDDLATGGYNLTVSSHVKLEDTRGVIDITQLNVEIEQIVARQSALRESIDAIVVDLEGKK